MLYGLTATPSSRARGYPRGEDASAPREKAPLHHTVNNAAVAEFEDVAVEAEEASKMDLMGYVCIFIIV